MKPFINEKHRISGTRISVYDVYHYLDHNCSSERIMDDYGITAEQLQAALDFIDTNRDMVHKRHLEIEERNARGNSPEVRKLLEERRPFVEAKWEEARQRIAAKKLREHAAGNPG